MHTGVYTKMSTEKPTKVEVFFCIEHTRRSHEDSHESAHEKFSSAHGKFSSAHENVHESELGQFSYVLFSHVLFLGQLS